MGGGRIVVAGHQGFLEDRETQKVGLGFRVMGFLGFVAFPGFKDMVSPRNIRGRP